jgi:sugar lactone lactonase YvrE
MARHPRHSRTSRVRLVAAAVLGAALTVAPVAQAAPRPVYDVRVFAKIGMPGQPEGIAVGRDQTVYVGTHNYGKGDARAASKVFAFNPAGKPVREYTIQGQPLDEDHGILAIATDADDVLYILDRNPARIVTLDPRSGVQRDYATFDDVPPCAANSPQGGHCSAGTLDLAPFPDYLVFAPDGTLYVTDLEQALIWRVAPGGGKAEVWFTDARLEGVFGPNGIQFAADGRTLVFAQTGSAPPGATDLGQGVIYTLPVQADGSPGALTALWTGRPVDGPDGLAIAKSGNIWVGLAGTSQIVVLSPAGEELARFPETPIHNQQQEIPFDTPGSLAFLGDRVLVTNHSFFTGTEANWAVLDVFAGEPGLPLFHPRIPAPAVGGTRPAAPAADDGLPATGPAIGGLAGLALCGAATRLRRRS